MGGNVITVRIGSEERQCPIDPNWVNQQIKGRQGDGSAPCVRVTIKSAGVDVALASSACGGGGGGRPPKPDEQAILDLWVKHHLNERDFSGGNLVSFLRQVGCS